MLKKGKAPVPYGGDAAPAWAPVGYRCPYITDDAAKKMTEQIVEKLCKGKKPEKKDSTASMIITIGPPGAGKSTVARGLAPLAAEKGLDAFVEYDMDDILDFFPEGKEIRNMPDMQGRPTGVGAAYGWENCINSASYVMDMVLYELLNKNYNIILNTHEFRFLIDAQIRGYACTLLYVAVTIPTAQRRAGTRALELGRFLSPADKSNAWGWKDAVERMWHNYRKAVAWYGMWADNFVVVVNEQDGYVPVKEDYAVYHTYPDPSNAEQVANFPLTIAAKARMIYNIVKDAHERAEAIAKKRR